MEKKKSYDEVDWDKLDKKKFFVVGAGMFSGVTTMLYPISVIKTRQMTSEGVASGLKGVGQTTRQIWQADGVRGFYRGFGTVLFGTIPTRVVYLTVLEYMKSTTTKVLEPLQLSDTVVAGTSNFAAAFLASVASQTLFVPVDVVSQRQMVHGSVLKKVATSTAVPAAAAAAQASHPQSAAGQGKPGTSSASASTAPSAARQFSTSSTAYRIRSTGAVSAVIESGAVERAVRSAAASCSTSLPAAAAAAARVTPAASSLQGSRSSLHPSSSHPPRPPPSKGVSPLHLPHQHHHGSSASIPYSAPTSTSSSPSTAQTTRSLATSASSPYTNPRAHLSGVHVARMIIQQEGIAGLYRGFGASVMLYAPSSAVWWSCYGMYQKLIWYILPSLPPLPSAFAEPSPPQPPPMHSSGVVVAVQTTSSVLAGATSAVITNPLDLIKTRLQVATVDKGVAPTFGVVLRQVVAEEGLKGLLRGALPRAASSILWGTCMVSVYEFLKRICAIPEDELLAGSKNE